MKKEETIEDVMNSVHAILKNSEGLEIEVLSWAFMELKNDPSLSICQAIENGFNEWVK